MKININELMARSGVQFGTSGVRGLVKDMSDEVCWVYTTAFLQYLSENKKISKGSTIGIAGDLRQSTPRIMIAIANACTQKGYIPINFGNIPSPAIALWGISEKIPTIMVTGSHIPDDRNGIKFNTAEGEILKPDEEGIKAQQVEFTQNEFSEDGSFKQQKQLPKINQAAEKYYIQRFTDFLPSDCLHGKKIGLYEQSSVSRDCFKTILENLGATVTSLGRSDTFIAVDTEAIRPEDTVLAKQWAKQYVFDCIISTDGDGDRPLISDEDGNWLRGDIAGVLCARYLAIENIVTPVSSNSVVEKCQYFNTIIRTKIGSPYVIEAMQQLSKQNIKGIVGYEANGGFLQQDPIRLNNKTLAPLPTRDAVIVPIAVMLLAEQKKIKISELLKTLPQRYTFSDRLKDFPTALSQKILASMIQSDLATNLIRINTYFKNIAEAVSIDTIDGVRITFSNDEIVHLRASGNAPELRCYTEANSENQAKNINQQCIEIMRSWKKSSGGLPA